MKLRKFSVWSNHSVPADEMQVYAAADVDALLARIRAAVVAEREATAGIPHPYGDCDGCDELHDEARAALDDLLADGGA